MISVNIEPVNFNISQELMGHVKGTFEEIDKYNDMIVNADVYLKSLTETATGKKEVSIKVNLPGKDIFISKEDEDFVSAMQELYDTLKVQLSKHKEMHKDRHEPVPGKSKI
ncbi:MAG: ribosome-associated translation inhibitor RaiA [Cyclobacteriaceae bacterium]